MNMGFFDDMTTALNRGKGVAGRTGKMARLKMQMAELNRQRRDAAAQLGASMYREAKERPELRAGHEAMFDSIARIDERRGAIEAELKEMDEEARRAREAAQSAASEARVLKCPYCGSDVLDYHSFCSGCGASVDVIRAAGPKQAPSSAQAYGSGRRCFSCGAPLKDNDLFCVACGKRQPE